MYIICISGFSCPLTTVMLCPQDPLITSTPSPGPVYFWLWAWFFFIASHCGCGDVVLCFSCSRKNTSEPLLWIVLTTAIVEVNCKLLVSNPGQWWIFSMSLALGHLWKASHFDWSMSVIYETDSLLPVDTSAVCWEGYQSGQCREIVRLGLIN